MAAAAAVAVVEEMVVSFELNGVELWSVPFPNPFPVFFQSFPSVMISARSILVAQNTIQVVRLAANPTEH